MNDKEKIQDIFARFYNCDEKTQKVQKEFLENKNTYSELLENTLRAICEIEKQLNISLSEQYKEFLKAEIGNYIYNPDSIDEFRAYDARELYEFNYVGEKIGHSAIEELKDFLIRAEGFIPRRLRRNKGKETRQQLPYENNIPRCLRRGMLIVGQDKGECSYFFDVYNTLGRGIDTFWRVDRNDCEDFEIVGNTFIEFLDAVANRKAIDATTPFEKKEEPIPENVKDILVEKLSGQLLAELRKIDKKGCRYNDIVNILKKFGRTASERK